MAYKLASPTKRRREVERLLYIDRKQAKKYCDFTILGDGYKIQAHKRVLVENSNFFYELCEEKQKSSIKVDAKRETIEILLDHMYDVKITLCNLNVAEVCIYACLWDLFILQQDCMENMDEEQDFENCKAVYSAAVDSLTITPDICDKLELIFFEHLAKFERAKRFHSMSASCISRLLQSNRRYIQPESIIWKIVNDWRIHNTGTAAPTQFAEILKHIQLERLSTVIIKKLLSRSEASYVYPDFQARLREEILRRKPDVPERKSIMELFYTTNKGDNNLYVRVYFTVSKSYGQKVPISSKKLMDVSEESYATLEDKLFVMSGNTCTTKINKINKRVYSIDLQAPYACRQRKPIMHTKSNFPCTASNGLIFISGGCRNNVFVSSLNSYDSSTNSWNIDYPSMKQARADHGLVALDGFLYAISGRKSKTVMTPSVECFDISSNTWSFCAPIPHGRSSFCTVILNHEIYVIGGKFPSNLASSDVSKFNPVANEWMQMASLLHARSSPLACVVDGKIYVYSGTLNDYLVTAVEVYNPGINQWSVEKVLEDPYDNVYAVVDSSEFAA